MLGYSSSIKKNLCSKNFITQGFYKYPSTDMSRDLKEKKKNG